MAHKLFIAGLIIFCLVSCKSESEWEEFDDPIFITYLHEHYDIPITENGHIDLNDETTLRALGEIKSLNLDEVQCISLTGINNLVSLTRLSCDGNRLTSLDVSYLRNLRQFDCSNNYLKTINASGCANLGILCCSNNQIQNLKLRECTEMIHIDCRNNRIKELDMRDCNKLNILYFDPQTDNENNIQELTILMPLELKKRWENEGWGKQNPNVIAIFF